jgi:phage tail sheath gpL-like
MYWVEVDPSMAGAITLRTPALLIGQKFATGTAMADVPYPIGRREDAQTLFGIGSMLERMVDAFFQVNTAQELYAVGVVEPAAGVAAFGTLTVATPPTNAGTLFLYVAGIMEEIGVGATDTVGTIAQNIVTTINGDPTLPVTASLVTTGGAAVKLTCKWKGTTGNVIDVRDSYHGALGGEYLPPGLTFTYPTNNKLSGGTGVPIFTNAITNLGDELYDYVALPFNDSTSLLAWETEFGFTQTGRWGWMRQLYGELYGAQRQVAADTGFSLLLTWFQAQNFPMSILAIESASPTPDYCWAAAYCAEAALGFTADPGRPLQTLPLTGCLPAPRYQRFNTLELNDFASNGGATQKPNANGVPIIVRETTMYQLNLYGNPDDAYTDMTTLSILSTLLRNQRSRITNKYPRSKLADDGTLFGPGQAIVTPSIVKAELVAEYAIDEFNGLVEDHKQFARNLIVERDSLNPNRLNVLYPPNLIGQLRIFAVLAQFRLLGQQQTTMPNPAP